MLRLDLATVELAQSVDALLRQSIWLVLLLCLRLEELRPTTTRGWPGSCSSSSTA